MEDKDYLIDNMVKVRCIHYTGLGCDRYICVFKNNIHYKTCVDNILIDWVSFIIYRKHLKEVKRNE